MHMGPLIDNLVQFHNIWVPQIRKSIDFAVHRHLSLFNFQVLLVVSLQSYCVLRVFMLRSSHNRKGPLANLQSNLEFLEVERLCVRILLAPLVNHISKVAETLSIPLFVKNYLAVFRVGVGSRNGSTSSFGHKRLVFGQSATLIHAFTLYLILCTRTIHFLLVLFPFVDYSGFFIWM